MFYRQKTTFRNGELWQSWDQNNPKINDMSIKGYEVGYIIFGHLHIKNKKMRKILWKTITRIKVKL